MHPEQQPEKQILSDVSVVSLEQHPELRQDLAKLYFQAWQKEGLCHSLSQAQNKLDQLDLSQAFAVLGPDLQLYAAIHTLPTSAASLEELLDLYPTYASLEAASAQKQPVPNPHFRICFSIIAQPGYRVQLPGMAKDISLAQFLLEHLPDDGAYKLAYSRHPAASMHEYLGGLIVAKISNSRPEDTVNDGANLLAIYPKTEAQKDAFAALRQARQTTPPPAQIHGPATIYTDCLFLIV